MDEKPFDYDADRAETYHRLLQLPEEEAAWIARQPLSQRVELLKYLGQQVRQSAPPECSIVWALTYVDVESEKWLRSRVDDIGDLITVLDETVVECQRTGSHDHYETVSAIRRIAVAQHLDAVAIADAMTARRAALKLAPVPA